MTGSVIRRRPGPRRIGARLPREHGFWAILVVVLSSAISRAPGSASAWLTVAVIVPVAVFAGSLLGPRIRRSAALQLGSAGALSLCGIPVQLAGSVPLSTAVTDGATWTAVFTAAALSVRACFARGARRHQSGAGRLTLASIIVPLSLAGVFAQLSMRAPAMAALVASAGITSIAFFRPTAKQLKPVGISLATIAVLAAVVLRVF